MIDFQEDKKEIDFQQESQSKSFNIDFQPETQNSGIDFLEEKPKMLTGKVEKNEELTPYEIILRDNTLTREQKAQKIKEYGENERKQIDKEHRKKMAKLYAGAALEIGSAAIPFGGAARLGGTLALKLAKPAFSQIAKKAITKNIGSGIASGLASGAMYGAGEGLINDKDVKGIAQSTLEGAGTGAVTGGLIGGASGKIATKFGRTKDVINKATDRTLKANEVQQASKVKYGETEDKVRELIQKRRANIDTSKFEALQKIDKFSSQVDDIAKELNVDSKGLREVLPFIRENTDLPLNNFDRKDLINLYNGLTKDQKEVLRMVTQNNFDEMETYWQNLAKVKNAKSSMSPEEYITHIWDMGEKDKAVVKNYFSKLKTKSQFEKARIIPTYKQGIEEGLDIPIKGGKIYHINLKPKTLDYAEIQKIHSSQLIDATENTRFFQELEKIKRENPSYAKEIEEIARPVIERTNEKEAAKTLAGKLLEKAENVYDTVNNFAKGCKFLFNGMHVVALTESAAAHEGVIPFKTFKILGN